MATLTKFITRNIVQFRQIDNTAGVNTVAGADVGGRKSWNTTVGNSINSANEIYQPAVLTIAANTATTIDLSCTAIQLSPVNKALTLARTKFTYIRVAAESGHVNGVLINGLAANSYNPLYATVMAGGHIELMDPTAAGRLVNSTSKNLVLFNQDVTNSINVTIVVVGGRT